MSTSTAVKRRSKLTAMLVSLLRYSKPHWMLYMLALILMGINLSFHIAFANVQQVLLETVKGDHADTFVLLYRLVFAGAVVFLLLMAVQSYTRNYAQVLAARSMSSTMFQKLLAVDFLTVQTYRSGDLVTRLTSDADTASSMIHKSVYDLLYHLLLCGIAFLYLSTIHLPLAVLVLVSGPVTFAAGRIFDRKLRGLSQQIRDQDAAMRSELQEAFRGIETIKSFQLQETAHRRYRDIRTAQNKLLLKKTAYNELMWQLVELVQFSIMIVSVLLLAMLVMEGRLDAGAILSFRYLMDKVQMPFINIAGAWGNMQESYGSGRRVLDIVEMDEPPVMQQKAERHTPNADSLAIVCKEVSFRYPDDTRHALDRVQLDIRHGEKVAIVGPSGGGKTTLLRLLLGLYAPTSGDMRLYGTSYAAQQELVAYMPQTPYLFTGTIADNLMYGSRSAAKDESMMKEAAETANAHSFIQDMKDGYDTKVGEKGSLLSGGQRQRIALARAFMKQAPLLVMDEPTSALDNENEEALFDTVMHAYADQTVLVATHQPSVLQRVDRILLIENGKLTGDGTLEQLLPRHAFLRQLMEQTGVS